VVESTLNISLVTIQNRLNPNSNSYAKSSISAMLSDVNKKI